MNYTQAMNFRINGQEWSIAVKNSFDKKKVWSNIWSRKPLSKWN